MSSEIRMYFKNHDRVEHARRVKAIDSPSFRHAVISRGSLLEIAVIAELWLEKCLEVLLLQHPVECARLKQPPERGAAREIFVRDSGLIMPDTCSLVEKIGFVRNALAHDIFILSHDVDNQDVIVNHYLDLSHLDGATSVEVQAVLDSLDSDEAMDEGEDALAGRDLLRSTAIVAHNRIVASIDRDRLHRTAASFLKEWRSGNEPE